MMCMQMAPFIKKPFNFFYQNTTSSVGLCLQGDIENIIQLLHGVICSIFVQLRHSTITERAAVIVIQSVRITNDLYRNDVVSSYEFAKGFTRSLVSHSDIRTIPDKIVEIHVHIVAKRELNEVLTSHTLDTESFSPENVVQVYIVNDKDKRGSLSSPREVLDINKERGSLSFLVVMEGECQQHLRTLLLYEMTIYGQLLCSQPLTSTTSIKKSSLMYQTALLMTKIIVVMTLDNVQRYLKPLMFVKSHPNGLCNLKLASA